MKCASEGKQKEVMGKFTTALLAADYYFSTGWPNNAIPHLELAVALFQEQYGGPLLSEDKDAIVEAFRSQNLKSKFSREFNAVRSIYLLSGAAQKLGLALPLDELPADLVPNSTHAIDMVQILLFSVMAAWFIMCGLDDYQTSRFTDNPCRSPRQFRVSISWPLLPVWHCLYGTSHGYSCSTAQDVTA